MDAPVAFLSDVLARAAARDRTAFDWDQIVGAMHALADIRTSDAYDLLVRLTAPGPDIPLLPESASPHLMSPRDMLRMLAIQILPDERIADVQPYLNAIESAERGPLQVAARRRLAGK